MALHGVHSREFVHRNFNLEEESEKVRKLVQSLSNCGDGGKLHGFYELGVARCIERTPFTPVKIPLSSLANNAKDLPPEAANHKWSDVEGTADLYYSIRPNPDGVPSHTCYLRTPFYKEYPDVYVFFCPNDQVDLSSSDSSFDMACLIDLAEIGMKQSAMPHGRAFLMNINNVFTPELASFLQYHFINNVKTATKTVKQAIDDKQKAEERKVADEWERIKASFDMDRSKREREGKLEKSKGVYKMKCVACGKYV